MAFKINARLLMLLEDDNCDTVPWRIGQVGIEIYELKGVVVLSKRKNNF